MGCSGQGGAAVSDLYEVAFDVTLEQTVLVEATSKKAAIERVKNGEYDVMDCESTTKINSRRNWTAEKIEHG